MALFLVFGHVAMIAGMLDPGLLGYEGTVQHEHKAPDSAHPH